MAIAQEKPTLIYIGDPMCSWCYGFSPELTKTLEHFGERVNLELVMGGLRPYNTQTMSSMEGFLKGHWKEVHERSQQPFKYGVLENDWVYDTEPPSRAVLVVREIAPDKEMAFFKAIQHAFYFENKNTNDINTYLDLAKQFDMDPAKFKALFESDEMKNAVRKDFEKAGELGVRGFPSMILKNKDGYTLIANGYMSAERIIQLVSGAIF